MIKKDGGPAFPSEKPVMAPHSTVKGALERVGTQHIHGMSLRDYFAGKFAQAWAADSFAGEQPDQAAHEAYRFADAMIKERERK